MGRRARGRDRARERRPRGRALLLADAPLHGARVHGQGRLRQGRVPNALAPGERPNRQKARRGCDAKLLLHVPPGRPRGGLRPDHRAVRVRGGAPRRPHGAQRGCVLPQAVRRKRQEHVLRVSPLPPRVSGAGVRAQGAANGRRGGFAEDHGPQGAVVGVERVERGRVARVSRSERYGRRHGRGDGGAVSVSSPAHLAIDGGRQVSAQGGVRRGRRGRRTRQ
mmetsp:Transcript_10361/g.42926  ORF Transcript_10361/g.42926 Transcript_10361/m.42926 type:complete len:222 (-) Transcript_10361:833-1498(-)